jgi:hypothetical protein
MGGSHSQILSLSGAQLPRLTSLQEALRASIKAFWGRTLAFLLPRRIRSPPLPDSDEDKTATVRQVCLSSRSQEEARSQLHPRALACCRQMPTRRWLTPHSFNQMEIQTFLSHAFNDSFDWQRDCSAPLIAAAPLWYAVGFAYLPLAFGIREKAEFFKPIRPILKVAWGERTTQSLFRML